MRNYYAGLPKIIRVGPYEIAISVRTKIDKRNPRGQYIKYPSSSEIKLRKEQNSPQDAVDTLVHELYHAIFELAKIESGREEDIVLELATWTTGMLVDNPRLLAWMGQMVCDRE